MRESWRSLGRARSCISLTHSLRAEVGDCQPALPLTVMKMLVIDGDSRLSVPSGLPGRCNYSLEDCLGLPRNRGLEATVLWGDLTKRLIILQVKGPWIARCGESLLRLDCSGKARLRNFPFWEGWNDFLECRKKQGPARLSLTSTGPLVIRCGSACVPEKGL